MANKQTHIIDVKTKGADKSKKKIKGVSGALGGMAKQAGIAAAAYFGARGLLNALKSSLSLYAEQQLAEVKLESALGKTSSTLKKYASALQQTTRFGDELILQGMAQLAFFIKDEKQLKIATKATLDLASAKGMDLVQAADLVAKSVGSSTNALSRYGIAAEGAVGSEGRLLSITDEIANLFGGQAEATTSSYQGAIDQLSNSFGDMQEVIGEALAPTIQRLAETFNDLLSTPVSEQIQKEKEDFSSLLDVLKDTNISTASRKLAIEELQSVYVEYLGDLDLEKASLEDIEKLQTNQVALLEKRIEQQILSEDLEDVALNLKRAEIELFREEQEALKGTGAARLAAIGGNVDLFLKTEELRLKKLRERVKEYKEEKEQIEAGHLAFQQRNKVIETIDKSNKSAIKTEGKLAKIRKSSTLEGARNEYNAALSGSKAHLINQIMKHVAFPFNLVLAAGAEGLIKEIFSKNKIMAAQYGADFITSGPQMMMVGEGSGPERVQVTPLVDENISGPQGGGITLNISGNVLTEEFTEDVIIPQIKEGLRLGGDIGIN